jgi:hypothetical protein
MLLSHRAHLCSSHVCKSHSFCLHCLQGQGLICFIHECTAPVPRPWNVPHFQNLLTDWLTDVLTK